MTGDPCADRVLALEEVIPDGFDALPADAPVVAVVVSLTFPGMAGESHAIMRDFTRSAFDQLLENGARAVLIDSSAADAQAALAAEEADAVLFLGGGDVDGALYGLQGQIPKAYGVDRAADEFCISLIRRTLEKDQPLFLDEQVTLVQGSKIAGILGRERVTVRSGHHQAVDRVAPDLVVSAVAEDGIVEGTEHPGQTWAVAVQWHPEDRDGSAKDRRAIFGALVEQAFLRRRQLAQSA